MTDYRRNQLLTIHRELHSGQNRIWLDNEHHEIQINNSHSSVKYEDKIFIKQGPTSSGVYGRLVKAGHQVTLIVRTGEKWGAIVDQEIWDPTDGA
jgi:hypothetical protein